MKSITQYIPNTLTLCNLMCGVLAITFAFEGLYQHVFWAIIAAALFDFADGMAARMLKAYSPLGADLDSLSDMVSFGVAPALSLYTILQNEGWVAYVPFIFAAAAALRLAKFNNDERQSDEFRGLPTPAATLFLVSFSFLASDPELGLSVWYSVASVVAFAALMVCDVPMFSLKFKDFSLKNNLLRYVFLGASVIIIALWGYLAPALIVLVYVLFSLTRRVTRGAR